MTYSIQAKCTLIAHPADTRRTVRYELLRMFRNGREAWSFLILEEEEGSVLESAFLYDLTSDAERAQSCYRDLVSGEVLPCQAEEILLEAIGV